MPAGQFLVKILGEARGGIVADVDARGNYRTDASVEQLVDLFTRRTAIQKNKL
ncbi:hypothetical protein D3C86_2207660 [compost metagenome]